MYRDIANKTGGIKIDCAWCVSGITFIRYAQNGKTERPNNSKVSNTGAIKPTGLNEILKIFYGHLREENLSFDNNYITIGTVNFNNKYI